ncbi:hypothetical protein [Phaeocystidibacter marisrubri]|uniref:Uncharacterized protein n=1 Tax=Phaeocystidibacter marisrubri TaxID=1577780 RepID=A0A6L3ZIK5_9FLAO|nr:hypothetical protein [Phaeocystidibacter marisrubri]KAB2817832.1 hypothetical protein F8C82_05360 [Phaeocystidibacter marisrubri]GGH73294.1 hypothetical protein GCM10011318_18180 [Phaeocystidibacter marisrubri]
MTNSHLQSAEIILLALAGISILAFWLELPHSPMAMMVSVGLVAIFYFYLSIFLFRGSQPFSKRASPKESPSVLATIGTILGGAGLGLVVAGFGLEVVNWMDATGISTAGCILIMVGGLAIRVGYNHDRNVIRPILLRLSFGLSLGIFTLFYFT